MADAATSNITLKITAKTGISTTFPEMSRAGTTTMGQLQQLFQKKLKLSIVHFFVMQGAEGFIPTPDQTLETLHALYGSSEQGGGTDPVRRLLSLAVSTQIFQG
jgi:hypothetical protein